MWSQLPRVQDFKPWLPIWETVVSRVRRRVAIDDELHRPNIPLGMDPLLVDWTAVDIMSLVIWIAPQFHNEAEPCRAAIEEQLWSSIAKGATKKRRVVYSKVFVTTLVSECCIF